MPGFHARFIAIVLEHGAGFAVFDLAVLIGGVAEIQLHRTERTVEVADFRGQRVVALLHVDAHRVFGRRAVVAVVLVIRQADIAVIPMVSAADGTTVLATVAVGNAVLAVVAIDGTLIPRASVAGNAQVVELARVGVQVQGKITVTGFQFARAAACGIGAAIAQLAAAMHAVDRFGGDAIIEGIDHATYRAAAVQQGGRAAYDLDALGVGRVVWHRMVIGQRRSIQRAGAVAQDADTVAIEAANHRPAGRRAKVGRRHAGQGIERLAQLRRLMQGQRVAFHHAGRRGQGCAAQRVGGDHLRVEHHG